MNFNKTDFDAIMWLLVIVFTLFIILKVLYIILNVSSIILIPIIICFLLYKLIEYYRKTYK